MFLLVATVVETQDQGRLLFLNDVEGRPEEG